jgi:hypothetical protein
VLKPSGVKAGVHAAVEPLTLKVEAGAAAHRLLCAVQYVSVAAREEMRHAR